MTEIARIGVLPQLGYGTWRRYGAEAVRCVTHALATGYRHIDTAAAYENEAEVGRAIRESGMPREEIFLTTKVWHDNLGKGRVLASAEASLQRLGLDYLDLLLIHWPSPGDAVPVEQYVTELAEVQARGYARNIGVSNFTRRHLDQAVAALGPGRIATNQVELNVTFANSPIAAHCDALGIPVTAYLPLARGAEIFENETLLAVARSHGATVAQVALAFLLSEGRVAIPASSNFARIDENFAAKDLALGHDEMAALRDLGKGPRRVDFTWAPDWN